MKEIKAYIKPHKVGAVAHALHRMEGLTGMARSTPAVSVAARERARGEASRRSSSCSTTT